MAATALLALFAWICSFAYRGQGWAIGVTGVVLVFLLSFICYGLTWILAMGVGGSLRLMTRPQRVAESPFAQHKEAPQVLEPKEDEA